MSDDILDINFDDDSDDGTRAADDVLDIELEGMDSPPLTVSASPQAPKSAPVAPDVPLDDGKSDLPMVSGGVCSRCGYALRPLETHCPRCARLGDAAPPPPSPSTDALSATDVPYEPVEEPPSRKGCLVGGIVGGLLLLAVAIGIPVAIWMQPAQQAKREYRLGLQEQLKANFDAARQHYQRALQLDPTMGLAAFSMGTTYLGLGDPSLMDNVTELTKRAAAGETTVLDTADEWFRKALEIGGQLAPTKRLMDQRIQTPAQLRAFAHASMALTALIRASGAMQADALDSAAAWFSVASREAQSALLDDPSNSAADQILKTVAPVIPPAG